MEIKQLNSTELEVMKYLWELDNAFMKDIVDAFPEPKPAYTTISTLLSRMCDKGYIGFERLGRDKKYYPILQKKEYFASQLNGMVKHFFNNSASQLASFFAKDTNLSLKQLEDLEDLVKEEISNKKKDE